MLGIRGYEVIREVSDYSDEEGNLSFPDEIDGQEVIGVEDGYLTVNNLVLHSDSYPIYGFYEFNEEEFDSLFDSEWRLEETKQRILELTAKENL